MEVAVARRYAQALLMVGQEHGKLEVLDGQARVLGTSFSDRKLRAFMMSPTIPAERKKKALARALEGKVDPLLINLGKLLVDNGRIGLLPDIMRSFDRLTDELRGVEEVTVVSAVPLSDHQQRQIVDGIRRFAAFGDLRVQTEVDPEVLGGVLVKLGNRVLDGTAASRLNELRQHMSAPAWRRT